MNDLNLPTLDIEDIDVEEIRIKEEQEVFIDILKSLNLP